MKTRSVLLLSLPLAGLVLAATLGLGTSSTSAQPAKAPSTNAAAEAELVKSAEKFIDAFGKGDARALAGSWNVDGDYTGPTGLRLVGRDAIEKTFGEFFAENKGVTLRIDVAGYRFPTPDVAIEDGTSTLVYPGGIAPSSTRYTNIHVKKDGLWLLESVRTSPYTPPSNHQHLRSLEWLIGEWADDVKDGEASAISFSWTENQNFLVSHFHTAIKNALVASGTQWIGWDPTAKTVRSWMFESHGGFGSGNWTKEAGKWMIRASTTLPDGKVTTATNIVTRVDANTLTWEVKDRLLDGKPLPEIKPVTMKRVGGP